MKLIQSMIVVAVVAIPALSFAQSNPPRTRADVRAQLVELQNVGYNPSSDHTQYPRNIEAAQARVNAEHGVSTSSYGPSSSGSSESGSGATGTDVIGLGPIYSNP